VRRALLAIALLALLPDAAPAWPSEMMTALGRDARRLLPRSLANLLGEREAQIQNELERFPPDLARALDLDLPSGRLRPETLAGLVHEADRVVEMLRTGEVSPGLVRLGALLRIPADLSDPVLAGVPQGWPPELAREYYALLAANLDRMPVVLDDSRALDLRRTALPELWQSLLDRSRPQALVIERELFREGRVVDHRRLDFHSPAWAVASLAYSRAVTGIAATWLAVWRDARGDTTNRPHPREVAPRDRAAPARPDAPGSGLPPPPADRAATPDESSLEDPEAR
jgi:hypothetical protein